jgi:FkbM family methyltransferase
MREKLIKAVRPFFKSIGIEIYRYRPNQVVVNDNIYDNNVRRQKIIQNNAINLVIDVGANEGYYVQQIRQSGYTEKIVSFEPLPDAFAKLALKAQEDKNWQCFNTALGEQEGTIEINIAGNSYSSSILPMLDRHIEAAPYSVYRETVSVEINTLDNIVHSLTEHDSIYLKIDVQGYEMPVLKGAVEILPKVRVIEIELSLVPLYESQLLYRDMIDYLDAIGFSLVSLEPNFVDSKTGHVLQIDGIFERR